MVRLERQRIEDLYAGRRIFIEVASRFVEELTRERDVPVVHLVDLAQIRDVRHAAAVARGNDARDDPLEAAGDVGEPDRSGHRSRAPAFGPGVWSKTSSTRISTTNAGQCATLRVSRR